MLDRRQLILIALLALWLAACYGVRFGLMENARWVAVCDGASAQVLCRARAILGLLIHHRVLGWLGLLCAVPGFFIAGVRGRMMAWLGLFAAAPALALYAVTPAVVAALLAGLRLVREERHRAAASSAEAPAQPSA